MDNCDALLGATFVVETDSCPDFIATTTHNPALLVYQPKSSMTWAIAAPLPIGALLFDPRRNHLHGPLVFDLEPYSYL